MQFTSTSVRVSILRQPGNSAVWPATTTASRCSRARDSLGPRIHSPGSTGLLACCRGRLDAASHSKALGQPWVAQPQLLGEEHLPPPSAALKRYAFRSASSLRQRALPSTSIARAFGEHAQNHHGNGRHRPPLHPAASSIRYISRASGLSPCSRCASRP
jgi:hypothetical protein